MYRLLVSAILFGVLALRNWWRWGAQTGTIRTGGELTGSMPTPRSTTRSRHAGYGRSMMDRFPGTYDVKLIDMAQEMTRHHSCGELEGL